MELKELKEFCEEQGGCKKCPLDLDRNKKSVTGCAVIEQYPNMWDVEAIEKAVKESTDA